MEMASPSQTSPINKVMLPMAHCRDHLGSQLAPEGSPSGDHQNEFCESVGNIDWPVAHGWQKFRRHLIHLGQIAHDGFHFEPGLELLPSLLVRISVQLRYMT